MSFWIPLFLGFGLGVCASGLALAIVILRPARRRRIDPSCKPPLPPQVPMQSRMNGKTIRPATEKTCQKDGPPGERPAPPRGQGRTP